MQGADDPLQPLASAQDLAANIPGSALFVIPGLGHDVPPQLAPLFAAAIPSAAARDARGVNPILLITWASASVLCAGSWLLSRGRWRPYFGRVPRATPIEDSPLAYSANRNEVT